MNRTKIEWTKYTWNPLGQGCPHNCWYCYAKRGAYRNYHQHLGLYKKGKRATPPCELCRDFLPHFHPERLREPWLVKKADKVFVCSTADLWAKTTEAQWRLQILQSVHDCPTKHTFQFLTKAPENFETVWTFPNNIWVGVTVTSNSELWKISELRKHVKGLAFVSFEPLLENLDLGTGCSLEDNFDQINFDTMNWIIIGKLTGSRRVKLDPSWVQTILERARVSHIPVFIKNNVGWPEKIQESPK